MKEIMKNILKSFDTNEGGFSARKLTAFVIVVMVIITHIKWLTLGNLTQLEMVLTIDYGFIAALFGMTTYHSLKTKTTKDIPSEPTNETTEEVDSEKE